MKTNKSFSKRIRVTKNKKLITRRPGGNHNNAKEARSKQSNRSRTQKLNISTKARNLFVKTK